MSNDAKKKRGSRTNVSDPVFITKTEIAAHMGIGNLATIDDWIASGTFPPPHSRPGERFAVWRRKYWNAYVETGEWPPASFPSRDS